MRVDYSSRRKALARDRYDRVFQPSPRARAETHSAGRTPSEDPKPKPKSTGIPTIKHFGADVASLFTRRALLQAATGDPGGVIKATVAAARHPLRAGQATVQPYVDILQHPLRQLEDHPLYTAAAVAPLPGAAGIAARDSLAARVLPTVDRQQALAAHLQTVKPEARAETAAFLGAPPGPQWDPWQVYLQAIQNSAALDRGGTPLPAETQLPGGRIANRKDLLQYQLNRGSFPQGRELRQRTPAWAFEYLSQPGNFMADQVDPYLALQLLREGRVQRPRP